MSYVGYGQSPYVQEPKVRFEAIGEAWAMVREKIGVWVLAALIIGGGSNLITYGVTFALRAILGTGVNPTPTPGNPFSALTPVYFIQLLISVVIGMVVGAFAASSLYGLAIKQARGENIELSDAFKFGNIGGIIVTNILVGLLTLVGGVLCYIPGIIAAIGTILAVPLTVDQGVSGPDAISMSWSKMKGNLLGGFGLMIVLGLIMIVSAIPLGLGLLVTYPLFFVTIAIIYRDFFNTEATMRGPTLDMPLPPQSAYGAGQYNAPTMPDVAAPGQSNVPPAPGRPIPPSPPAAPGQMGSIDM